MKTYGRYPPRSPRPVPQQEPDAKEAFAEIAGDFLDYTDRLGDLFSDRSEITRRYARSLMSWSMLVIAVFGLGVHLDRIPALGVKLEDTQTTFFNVGVIVVLLYNWVMYQLHDYKDTLVGQIRTEVVNLAFAPKLDSGMRRAEEIGGSLDPDDDVAKNARRIWEKLVKRISPTTIFLIHWTSVLVPVVLFLAAMTILALEFRTMNILWAIISIGPVLYRWIERKLVRRDALKEA